MSVVVADAARGGQDQKEEDAEAWQPSDAEAVETEETHVIHVEVDATAAPQHATLTVV